MTASAGLPPSTSSPSSESSTSVISGAVIEVEGQDAAPVGHDRRRAIVLAFALCLAVGSAVVGRDGPLATAPVEPVATLTLPPGTIGVTFASFPDRLANEQLPVMGFVPVNVRTTQGLATNPVRPGDGWTLWWTENGTVYWLWSDTRDTRNLLRIADDLR